MSVNKNDLIKKLESILKLYRNTVNIKSEMDSYVPTDSYKREVTVPRFPGKYESEDERLDWQKAVDHEDGDAIAQMAEMHERYFAPKKPVEPKATEFEPRNNLDFNNSQAKLGCLSKAAAGISIFFFVGILLNLKDSSTVVTLIILSVVFALAFAFVQYKLKAAKDAEDIKNSEALLAHTQREEEIRADYEAKLKAYEEEYAAYELLQYSFIEEYTAWREVYLKHLEEEDSIAEKLSSDRSAAINNIYDSKYLPAKKDLDNENDLVSEEYLPVLNTIIELLKSGRADDIKEAINIYEEIAYRERQLQLQKEQEEQRRREEELRRQDEERHHREQMALQKEQERQRRYDEEQRQRKEDERRAREAEERKKDEQKAADRARMEAKSRCHWCTNYYKCSVRHNPPLNCTGFRPGNTYQI